MKTKIIIFLAALNLLLPKVNAQYAKLLDFTGVSNGKRIYGDVISDTIYHYGMTYQGGIHDSGTVFKIQPDGTGYLKLFDFGGGNGSYPHGSLYKEGSFLYGMTSSGGANNGGVIFKIKKDGTAFTKLHDFGTYNGAGNGFFPKGNLISDGTWLYGLTLQGGAASTGTLFKIKPDGSLFSVMIEFSGNTGANPQGSLYYDGTYLYGTTQLGGANASGTLFKIKTDATGYVKLYDFDDVPNGEMPFGSLISDGTYLYGMTLQGGTLIHGNGVIFKIKPDGSSYQLLKSFSGNADGATAFGSLILVGSSLYGFTSSGGPAQNGNIFKIQSDGTAYTQLYNFPASSASVGIIPNGTPLYENGYIYGTTSYGGSNGNGVLFKYGVSVGINEFGISNENISVYPNPSTDHLFIQSSEKIKTIKCSNYIGQTVDANFENNYIDISNLSEGIYFLNLITLEGSNIIQKFIKE